MTVQLCSFILVIIVETVYFMYMYMSCIYVMYILFFDFHKKEGTKNRETSDQIIMAKN